MYKGVNGWPTVSHTDNQIIDDLLGPESSPLTSTGHPSAHGHVSVNKVPDKI